MHFYFSRCQWRNQRSVCHHHADANLRNELIGSGTPLRGRRRAICACMLYKNSQFPCVGCCESREVDARILRTMDEKAVGSCKTLFNGQRGSCLLYSDLLRASRLFLSSGLIVAILARRGDRVQADRDGGKSSSKFTS